VGGYADFSPDGMTVEKCVELGDSYRYVGVEFSGEAQEKNPTTPPRCKF